MSAFKFIMWGVIAIAAATACIQVCLLIQWRIDVGVRAKANEDVRTFSYPLNKDTGAAYEDGLRTGIRQERQKHGEPTEPNE